MRKPDIDLEMIGIPVGATLTFWTDADINCIVVQLTPPRVVFNEEVLNLTEAARRAAGASLGSTMQPAVNWLYQNKRLFDRRKRFEDYHRQRE